MPLSTNDISAGGSGEGARPYYIDEHRVRRVKTLPRGPDYLSDPVDLAVRIFYDIEGVDVTDWSREPSLDIFGDVRTGPSGHLLDWGSAFKVAEAFSALGVTFEVRDDLTIPRKALEEAQGCPFLKLRYVTAERDDGQGLFYNDFRRIKPVPRHSDEYDSVEAARQDLEDLFLSQHEDGWVPNYRPELVGADEAPQTSSEDHSPSTGPLPSSSTGNAAPKDDARGMFEPNDGVPF